MAAPVPGAKAVGKGGGLTWLTNPFFGNGKAATLVLDIRVGMAAATAGFAKDVEDYAREHAPWEDRSGEARSGLKAEARQRLWTYTIILYHTVDYGIWLEIRWDGKYAIILPTIEHMGHELMGRLEIASLVAGELA
jgi:hypothetical protein